MDFEQANLYASSLELSHVFVCTGYAWLLWYIFSAKKRWKDDGGKFTTIIANLWVAISLKNFAIILKSDTIC